VSRRCLVYGLAVTGDAVARALLARGDRVVLADDRLTDAVGRAAQELDHDVVVAPDGAVLAGLVAGCDLVLPSPGIPETHRLFAATRAAGVPVWSELDLAYEWEQDRPGGPRPMVGITGTDGKTTTTLLATEMLEASGRRAVACGNTEVPLVAALDLDVDVLVVECTSFRLAWAERFRPVAGTWLNLAADHLDWHRDLESYAAAKARLWEHQGPADTAIGFADDAEVMRRLAQAPSTKLTFASRGADYRDDGGVLTGPAGAIAEVRAMRRRLPHDITNALAAAATVLEPGLATVGGVGEALASFEGAAHRISLVAERHGVAWYDDSKATTPHAAATAVRAFPSVVLIAGGKNKGLDLGGLRAVADHLRAVVAIGQAAPEVAAAFEGLRPVVTAASMDEAVELAHGLARAGDTVLLSPACASFDWYGGYAERGDDFVRSVHARLETR
jgi:UDP-N-acetylmuramoylalanine--D-glutamate ligase